MSHLLQCDHWRDSTDFHRVQLQGSEELFGDIFAELTILRGSELVVTEQYKNNRLKTVKSKVSSSG
jgi:hypothetical protein